MMTDSKKYAIVLPQDASEKMLGDFVILRDSVAQSHDVSATVHILLDSPNIRASIYDALIYSYPEHDEIMPEGFYRFEIHSWNKPTDVFIGWISDLQNVITFERLTDTITDKPLYPVGLNTRHTFECPDGNKWFYGSDIHQGHYIHNYGGGYKESMSAVEFAPFAPDTEKPLKVIARFMRSLGIDKLHVEMTAKGVYF